MDQFIYKVNIDCKFETMIKIGVVGCGHLGEFHIKLLTQSKKFDLKGFIAVSYTHLTLPTKRIV